MKRVFTLLFVLVITAPRFSLAQERGATALGDELAGLGVTGRVLLIGAHPDDEDTALIAWLAKHAQVEIAYLSLTRGDGGQNLIGNELGPALGMIRTEELLAARRIDGGRQYFTRAYDFGFSKTAEETFKHWPRDSILEDVVTIVRAFRPHVIVSQFSGTPRDGHGHHQVSGILAREAFDAAADTVRFPRMSTEGLGPWQAMKFYRANRGSPAGATVEMNVGEYDAVLGRAYSEIAAASRSQHASQGQGMLARRGVRMDYLRLEATRPATATADGATVARERTIFDGIDTSWSRFASLSLSGAARSALDSLPAALAVVHRVADLAHPSVMVAALAQYLRLVDAARSGTDCRTLAVPLCDGVRADLAIALDEQHRRATTALLQAAGVAVEADAERELVALSDSVPVRIHVFNQGTSPVELIGARVWSSYGPSRESDSTRARAVPPGSADSLALELNVQAPSTPWWLARPPQGDMFRVRSGRSGFTVDEPLVIGEDRVTYSTAAVRLRVASVPVTAEISPIVYRYADRARGEQRRPVAGVPGIAVLLESEIEYARANAPLDREIRVHLESALRSDNDVTVALQLPAGLTGDSASRGLPLRSFGSADVFFHVRGELAPGPHTLSAVAQANGQSYDVGYVPIEYEHIRSQRLYRRATVLLQAVDTKLPRGLRVGYIAGVGDNVAPMLEQLGISTTMIDPASLSRADLSQFTTIVIGPRAYAASPALVANNGRLLAFVYRGGTMVVQYGQDEIGRPGITPFPITPGRSTDRVTEEHTPVRFTDPRSPVLRLPNRIGEQDFDGWVQERATYMPRTFDSRYRTMLSMNDTGESPLESGILVAPYGDGTYVYTTLAFFRQLPAGHPGAARLFVNLLVAGRR